MLQIDDRRFNRLAVSAIAIGFALLSLAFAVGMLALFEARQSTNQVNHTYQVVSQLADLDVWVERAETGSRGYLLSPDPVREKTFRDSVARTRPALDRLRALTRDNPVQQRNVAVLRRQVDDELTALASIMTKATSGQIGAARTLFVREVAVGRVHAIRTTTATMRGQENRLLAQRTASERRSASVSQIVLFLTALLLIGIGVGGAWLVRRYTADLTSARDRLNSLNTNLEGAVVERTADLMRANEELQRFAYIVSHDLRSPLVNVMGFTAELEAANGQLVEMIDRVAATAPALLTDEARIAAKEDLPEAIGFIRSSTQKMDRLINAILKLSREGRRTLTPEHLIMSKVVESIIDTLEHRLQEIGATIEIQSPLPDMRNDRVAIEQLFSNLIENAVKYLRPGVAGHVIVRGRRKGDRLSYEIEDNGRGIDPRDHERIFDLFRRSGTQDQPGEGIGLAHVRALAYRLGGTIDVTSSLGEGATFILNLPVTYHDVGAAA